MLCLSNYQNHVLILLEDVDLVAVHAARYAKSLSGDVAAFAVVADEDSRQTLTEQWAGLGTGIPIECECPAEEGIIKPLLERIRLRKAGLAEDDVITVILPRLIAGKRLYRALHGSVSRYVERRLLQEGGIVVAVLPYLLEDDKTALEHESAGYNNPQREASSCRF